jgi:hypothetical protein
VRLRVRVRIRVSEATPPRGKRVELKGEGEG